MRRGDLAERGCDGSRPGGECANLLLHPEAQRREHLVVARAPEVNPPAGRSDALGEPSFERRMHIFVAGLDSPKSLRMFGSERLQCAIDRREIAFLQQSLRSQHRGVRARSAGIVGDETVVESRILACRVSEHLLVERISLVPESAHVALRIPLATSISSRS